MNKTQKLFSILLLNMTLSVPTYAKIIERPEINFDVQSELLLKGHNQYSFKIVSPSTLLKKYSEFKGLDSLALRHKPDVKIIVSKNAYIVNKPIGHFDHEHITNTEYMKHLMGKENIKKVDEHSFKVIEPKLDYSYRWTAYFDSDDVSTLSTSTAIQAVTTAKKLDVMVQSAPSTVFSESTQFSKYFEGAVSVAAYAPLKEDKTLVIVYQMTAVKKRFADSKILKPIFLQGMLAQQERIKSFRFSK